MHPIYRTGTNCATKWLASTVIIGSYATLAKLHEQQPLYSSTSVLGTYFCVTVLPSHRRIDNILSPFFKTGNDVTHSTMYYFLSL